MKTKPTEACKMIEESWYAIPYMGTDYQQDSDIVIDKKDVYEIAKKAFKEGQSNPKIKQLEWVEIDEDGVKGIQVKTPFGDYDMYERVGHDGSILWGFDQEPYVFDTEIEAKMYAQADFERRVMECLDL